MHDDTSTVGGPRYPLTKKEHWRALGIEDFRAREREQHKMHLATAARRSFVSARERTNKRTNACRPSGVRDLFGFVRDERRRQSDSRATAVSGRRDGHPHSTATRELSRRISSSPRLRPNEHVRNPPRSRAASRRPSSPVCSRLRRETAAASAGALRRHAQRGGVPGRADGHDAREPLVGLRPQRDARGATQQRAVVARHGDDSELDEVARELGRLARVARLGAHRARVDRAEQRAGQALARGPSL